MTQWRTDIENAPRGYHHDVERTVKGKTYTVNEFVSQPVWLVAQCGTVILSRWLGPDQWSANGRWNCLGSKEKPIAWRDYVDGEFPCVKDQKTKKSTYPNGEHPIFDAASLTTPHKVVA